MCTQGKWWICSNDFTSFLILYTCLAFAIRLCAAFYVGMLQSTLKQRGTAWCLSLLVICWWPPMRRMRTGQRFLSKWESPKKSNHFYASMYSFIMVYMNCLQFANLKCTFRCTLRTHWVKESGWTVLTVRISWTTSRLLLAQRCPQKVCCCRLTQAALVETSVQV